MHDAHLEKNRRSWNLVTPAHQSHKRDQARFLRSGGTTLFPEEIELLGDVRGLRIAHLLCNCGQDTLSLAARGATVVGVDLADAPIEHARRLTVECGIHAEFERAEVMEWLAAAAKDERRFDVVFASYGALPWIADLPVWMRGVAAVLAPGGRLVVVEFHPVAWSVDGRGALADDYFLEGPIAIEEGVSDYVARSGTGLAPMGFETGATEFRNTEPAVAFQWTVGDVVQATVDSGLRLETLREYGWSNGCRLFDGMRETEGRRFVRAEGVPSLPLMLGLVARAPD